MLFIWLTCVVRAPTHRTAVSAIAAFPHPDQPATPTGRRNDQLCTSEHAVGAAAPRHYHPGHHNRDQVPR